MDRLISEQAVLEAFREYQGSISDFYKAIKALSYDDAKYHEEHGEVVVDKAVWEDAKKALEQEPKWIPVSERLPKKVGTYITTVDYGRYGLATGQRYYHGKRLGWEDDCVIAWRPLPKPYKPHERSDKE